MVWLLIPLWLGAVVVPGLNGRWRLMSAATVVGVGYVVAEDRGIGYTGWPTAVALTALLAWSVTAGSIPGSWWTQPHHLRRTIGGLLVVISIPLAVITSGWLAVRIALKDPEPWGEFFIEDLLLAIVAGFGSALVLALAGWRLLKAGRSDDHEPDREPELV